MKLSQSILFLFAIAGIAMSTGIPVIGEYARLDDLCQNGGSNVYVGVLYKGGDTATYSFDQCYPYTLNGNIAQMAVFCKSVTCYSNPNPDCTGGADPPVPVPVPAGTTLINAANFVQLLGQGATCQQNGIPV